MPWLIGVLGGLVGRVFTLAFGHFTFLVAQRIAIVTGYIIVSGTIFIGVALGIKTLVLSARVFMPPHLAVVTYFLPASLNQFFATFVVIRLSYFVWRWTHANLAAYADVPNRKMLY